LTNRKLALDFGQATKMRKADTRSRSNLLWCVLFQYGRRKTFFFL